MSDKCPCCSGQLYVDCCQPYLTLKRIPATPELLMRSRYTAYTLANIEYIQQTMSGEALNDFSYEDSLHWAKQSSWLRLEIMAAPLTQGDQGWVEFKAYYALSGIEKCLHERSIFHRVDHCWYYVGGAKTRVIDNPEKKADKLGRNDPCFCGSGKKYKKCCYRQNH